MSGCLRRDTAVLSVNHVAKANTYLSLHCVTIEKLRREKIRIFGRLVSRGLSSSSCSYCTPALDSC